MDPPSTRPDTHEETGEEKTFYDSSWDQPAIQELQKSEAPVEKADVHEGGAAAWLALLGGWLGYFSTFGYTSISFGVYQDTYLRHGSLSPSKASAIGSVQGFFVMTSGIFGGRLLDTGHFRLLMAGATAIYLFSNFMHSLANQDSFYQLLLSQGFGVGIGAGMLTTPLLAVQAHHWRKNRAHAMTVVSSAGAAGGVVFPIMLNRLINGPLGFNWAIRATSFLLLGLLGIVNLIIRPGKGVSKSNTGHSQTVLQLLKDGPYMMMNFGCCVGSFGIMFRLWYIQVFAIARGVNETLAFYLISIMNGVAVLTRAASSLFAAKLGVLNTFALTNLLCGAVIPAMFAVHTSVGAIVFAAMYGAVSGCVFGLIAPSSAVFARHPSEIGLRVGMTFFFIAIGTLSGAPIIGALLSTGPESQYPWYRAIVFSMAMCVIGSFGITLARTWRASRAGAWRA